MTKIAILIDPDTQVVVPREPTGEMQMAAIDAYYWVTLDRLKLWWNAMISAAPAVEPATVVDGWMDISSAPMDGTPVLVMWMGEVRYAHWTKSKRRDQKTGWKVYHTAYYNSTVSENPTHWMPLPAAPQKGGE